MSEVPAHSTCPHCGAAVEGPPGTFCCSGCELAAAVLEDAGLLDLYSNREAPSVRPAPAASQDWTLVPQTALPDGTFEAIVAVDGLTCAGCATIVEALLDREDGVSAGELSYATGRLRLRYDPEKTDLDAQSELLAQVGYTLRPVAAEPTSDRGPLIRLGVAVFCAANVMGMAVPTYLGWVEGMDPRFVRLFAWASLLVTTPSALWAAAPFYTAAWQGLRARTLHMDLPLALAIGGLYAQGVFATLTGGEAYLDSLTMLIALLLVGRALEARGQRDARKAADLLGGSVPSTARKVDDGQLLSPGEVVPSAALVAGDVIAVDGGQALPADITVIDGEGRASLALVSGETEPMAVLPGTPLPAGSELLVGRVLGRVDAAGIDTVVGQMQEALVSATATARTPTAADRLAPAFTAATLLLGITAVALTPWLGQDEAVRRAIAVLVVACPCALSLARPLAVSSALAGLARRGLWLRDGDALLSLTAMRRVALDKTGTLTESRARVVDAEDSALRIAAALEVGSAHPIARAIVEEAVARGVALPRATMVREVPGRGVLGIVDGREWEVTSAGPNTVALLTDGARHEIHLAHTLRGGAAPALDALRAEGLDIEVLTGDRRGPSLELARALDLPEHAIHAELTPLDKVELVDEHTLFVGDGLNDGPALARAGVGLAVARGAASSVAAADGVIRGGALTGIADALATARATERTIHANIRNSLLYNVISVLAAMLGWVNPLVAAVLMPISSLAVVVSSARLSRGAR
ncbi:MAG: HAD family hydrolase [Deltaproteobacteria bacterium]|nr:MAG: HAD family hydrolase [Deltaproteobacteria bacterium]